MPDEETQELLRKARDGDTAALFRLEEAAFRTHGRRARPPLNVVQATAPFGPVALCIHPARDIYQDPFRASRTLNHPNVVIHIANFVMKAHGDQSLLRDDLRTRQRLGNWDTRIESLQESAFSVLVNFTVDKHLDGAMALAFVAGQWEGRDYGDGEDDGEDEDENARDSFWEWTNRHIPLFLRRWLPQNEDFIRQGRRYAAIVHTKALMTRYRALQKQFDQSRRETAEALLSELELGADPTSIPRTTKRSTTKVR